MTALVLVFLTLVNQAEPPTLRLDSPFAPAETPFTAASWNRLLETARASRTDRGYWHAVVRVDSIVVDSAAGLVRPFLAFEDGPMSRMAALRLEGGRRVRATDLERTFRAHAGKPADRNHLDRFETDLLATGWFRSAAVTGIEGAPDAARLVVRVVERPSAASDALIGYAPGGDGWMGYFDLDLRHTFGVGTYAGFRFERLRPLESSLEAHGQGRWFGAEARFFNQDTTYRTTEITALPRWESGHRWTLEAVLGLRHVRSAVSTSTGFDGLERRIGLRATYADGQGLRLGTESTIGLRETRTDAWRTTTAALLADWEQGPWALRLRARTTEARVRTPDQAYRIGGAADLRGYREGELRANRYAWSDAEYRWGAADDTQLFVFAGGGYAAAGLWSAGFGFRYPTPLGRMELTYGGRGLVHVRLSAGR